MIALLEQYGKKAKRFTPLFLIKSNNYNYLSKIYIKYDIFLTILKIND